MQPIDEIEKSYETPDPWGFKSSQSDYERKRIILQTLCDFMPDAGFKRALDLGAGEGWITRDLPAKELFAFEISQNAKNRLPQGVTPVDDPFGFYDLVIATGVLYSHYDYNTFFNRIERHASGIVLTCNIKAWERPELSDQKWVRQHLGLEQEYEDEFQYRKEFIQKLRVFRKVYECIT